MKAGVPCLVDYNSNPLDFSVYLHSLKLFAIEVPDGSVVRIRSSTSDVVD
jgi:hypothetical protein